MSVAQDIPILIDRLRRADIPMDHLCYELDEHEWREFIKHIEKFQRYQDADLTYIDDATYMGLHIRKRRPV